MDDLISRQAAIEAIKKYDFKSPEYASYYLMRLKNAIKADLVDDVNAIPPVEAEPTEEQIKKYILDHNLTHKVFEPVRRGKWMEMGTNADGTHNIKCSECGAGYKTKGHANSILTKAKYKFCPRCGAKMNSAEM